MTPSDTTRANERWRKEHMRALIVAAGGVKDRAADLRKDVE